MQILLSRTQAGTGRLVKQEMEKNSQTPYNYTSSEALQKIPNYGCGWGQDPSSLEIA